MSDRKRPDTDPQTGEAGATGEADLQTGEAGATGEQPAPAPPMPEESETAKLRAEAEAYLDDLRRLKAEFENYRKRVVKEQTALVEMAAAGLIERLLPVLDNFELALIAADRTKDYDSLVRGVELVFGELQGLMHTEGLKRIDAAPGQPFDPAFHEAVMQGEGPADGKPVVEEVFRAGYTLKGRVLRPAMVKVARRVVG